MAKINNPLIIKKLIDEAKINTSLEKVPDQLAEKIIPTLNVNPEKIIQTKNTSTADTASATIYTTSLTKDTFLIGGQITLSKDVVSDATFSQITITPFSDSGKVLLILRYEPLTAGQFSETISLTHPLKLERGSSIIILNNSATASIDIVGTIFFYEVEP